MSETLKVEAQGLFSVYKGIDKMNIGKEFLPASKGIIYVITDISNNKLYIGQTTKSLRERWREHVRYSRRENMVYPLAKAIKEKGLESFYVNVLEVLPVDRLHDREMFWIDTLRTHISQNGYNATEGGIDGNKIITNDDKILEIYREVKSIRETAKIVGVSRDVVNNRVKKSGVGAYSMGEIRGIPFKVTAPNGETIYFVSKMELSNWFIENGIGKYKNVETLRRRIGIEEKENYSGYVIEKQK